MSVKEIIEQEIVNINGELSLIISSLDYINEYGYVGLYDDDITEEELKTKCREVEKLLQSAGKILEEIDDIICEQFQY